MREMKAFFHFPHFNFLWEFSEKQITEKIDYMSLKKIIIILLTFAEFLLWGATIKMF